MKVLIAEDDPTFRLALGATLKKLGHDVTAVENGREAWEAWQQGEFDLLISEWMMSDVDGLELCRRIRAEPRLHYTYIILLTALSGKRSYLDGMDAGADDFLTKPLDQEHLAARLRVAQRILDCTRRCACRPRTTD
jgi:DNA-binding response OmpR family regulator